MNVLQKKPEVVDFAGPNGSGKSTFTELLKPPMDYISADEIKKNLKCSDLEAAQLAERQNVLRVRLGVESGGHNVPEEKIISSYDECDDWYLEDIQALTTVEKMEKKKLN